MFDFRSDTVTRPTSGMRAAMAAAEVGDDVFGDDPTVNALQQEVADLLGKDAALFVPSGTMANQLALRVHTVPGDAIVAHARSHIFRYESGAPAALAGVMSHLVDSDDGTLPLSDVVSHIFDGHDPHHAPTRLVCVENTHNACGGRVIPREHLDALGALCRDRDLRAHLDGARLWHAAVATGAPLDDLCAPFDTVSVCLSKGLGAPIGSLLVGDRASIVRAHRFRKMYGGAMRQVGILAAAGRYALAHQLDRLADDHRRARALAEALAAIPAVRLDVASVETNLVYFEVDPSHAAAPEGALVEFAAAAGVGMTYVGGRYRLVTHLDVDDEAAEAAVGVVKRLLA